MENRPKLYATAAFAAGILIALGFKDFYPDLESRFRRRHTANKTTIAGTGLNEGNHINLEDHEKNVVVEETVVDVGEGIEACIGNTPLFKIKSLSEETGCEIFGKAEVQTVIALVLCDLLNQWPSFLTAVAAVRRTE